MSHSVASCNCSKLIARTRGVSISECHGLTRQERTGCVFDAQSRFAEDCAEIQGDSREYMRTAESSDTVRFHFCVGCVATVFYTLDAAPGFVSVPIGAFAAPHFSTPGVSIYETHEYHWLSLPEGIEYFNCRHLRFVAP